jgi:hypothetical protein
MDVIDDHADAINEQQAFGYQPCLSETGWGWHEFGTGSVVEIGGGPVPAFAMPATKTVTRAS